METERKAPSRERRYTEITGTKTKQLVLDFLSSNPRKSYSVLDLHNILSIPESTISINMTDLSNAGIVTFERKGKYKYYTLVQRYVPVFRSVFHSLTQIASESRYAEVKR